jgi:hypothetical protein
LKEYTVQRFRLFDKARSVTDTPAEFLARILGAHIQMLGQQLDLGFGYPDMALFRAHAALAATGTLKMQTGDIPFIIFHRNALYVI